MGSNGCPKRSRIHYLAGVTLHNLLFLSFRCQYLHPSFSLDSPEVHPGYPPPFIPHSTPFPCSWFLAILRAQLGLSEKCSRLSVFVLTWDDELPASKWSSWLPSLASGLPWSHALPYAFSEAALLLGRSPWELSRMPQRCWWTECLIPSGRS